jgi:hypothetical protein
MAEGVRFELTREQSPLPVFKTGALNHSATLPTLARNSAQCPSVQAISAKLIISPGSLLRSPVAKPANTSQLGGRNWSAQSLGPVE